MDKWLLNAKKTKLAVSTHYTNNKEKSESCANEAGT
jgi:hypothetical protein